MNDLLNLAMKAHGGLERWKQVRNMQAKVTLNGTLWRIKGRPDGLSGVVMRLNTKQPDLTITPFPKPGTAGHFTPSRVWIEDAKELVVSELKNPRDSFAGAVLHDEVERASGTLLRQLLVLELRHGPVPTGSARR